MTGRLNGFGGGRRSCGAFCPAVVSATDQQGVLLAVILFLSPAELTLSGGLLALLPPVRSPVPHAPPGHQQSREPILAAWSHGHPPFRSCSYSARLPNGSSRKLRVAGLPEPSEVSFL